MSIFLEICNMVIIYGYYALFQYFNIKIGKLCYSAVRGFNKNKGKLKFYRNPPYFISFTSLLVTCEIPSSTTCKILTGGFTIPRTQADLENSGIG